MAGDLAAAVSEKRLWQRHVDMARIGGTPKGGVNRLALTVEDNRARQQLCAWAVARNYQVFVDGIGNIFVRRPGTVSVRRRSEGDLGAMAGDDFAALLVKEVADKK